MSRRALALVNVAAIERNCARMRQQLIGGGLLCAVVKADGYGHGAVRSAIGALAGGASWLAVAGAREALALRAAGLLGPRILVMGALSSVELAEALEADADVVVWEERHLQDIARAGGGRVHVKLDSGMGRLGTRDTAQATHVARAARDTDGVQLAGVMTHFATADDRTDGFFDSQLSRFAAWVDEVRREHPNVIAHAANSAATLRDTRSHFDMVRCGISIYGMDPFGGDPAAHGLEPALELRSYVAEIKECAAGDSAGYGRRFIAQRDTHLAVLPIGYGDGWRRALSANSEVLIAGQRHPVAGTISMDNMTVDVGASRDPSALRGADVVLLGGQQGQRITAEEIARRIGSINYEVTCGLTPRVPRVHHRDGLELAHEREDATTIGGRAG